MWGRNAGEGRGPTSDNAQPGVVAPPKPKPELQKTHATLKLVVVPGEARLTLDGTPLALHTTELVLPVSEDSHKLEGDASDFEAQTLVFKVTGDERLTLELKPAPSSRSKRTVALGHRAVAPSVTVTTPVATATAAKAPQASCDNPFYVDAQGIKRVRPGCL
jgi:hypothetical protein